MGANEVSVCSKTRFLYNRVFSNNQIIADNDANNIVGDANGRSQYIGSLDQCFR